MSKQKEVKLVGKRESEKHSIYLYSAGPSDNFVFIDRPRSINLKLVYPAPGSVKMKSFTHIDPNGSIQIEVEEFFEENNYKLVEEEKDVG